MEFTVSALSIIAWSSIVGMMGFLVWVIKKYITSTEKRMQKSEESINNLAVSFNTTILTLNKAISELSNVLTETKQSLLDKNEGCKERHNLISQTLRAHAEMIDEHSLKINTAEIEIKNLKNK